MANLGKWVNLFYLKMALYNEVGKIPKPLVNKKELKWCDY